MNPPLNSPLDGWILAQVEGKSYLGLPLNAPNNVRTVAELRADPNAPFHMSPVYEFAWLMVPTPQGLVPQPNLKTPFGCISARAVPLPRAGVWVPIAELDTDEQKVFAQLVRQTEEGLLAARAQAANLTIMPAGTKLPPMMPGNGGRRG